MVQEMEEEIKDIVSFKEQTFLLTMSGEVK
jgi:hypothetical protein